MLKKLMLFLSCISLLALIACSEDSENGSSYTIKTDPSVVTFEETVASLFSIEIISDDELEELEYHHDINEINYALAHDVFLTEGLNVRFTFYEPVTDFAIIEVQFVNGDEEEGVGVFKKTATLYEFGDVDPDIPLILTHYSGYGTTPISGFYFTGPDGVGRWYTFQQDARDGGMIWQTFDWSHDHDLFIVDEAYDDDLVADLIDQETETDLEPPIEMPHPFAVALAQFMTDVDDQAIAFLVDVDGNGTDGMVVINSEGHPIGTLFYLYDGTLQTHDMGLQDVGFITSRTMVNDRLVNLMGDEGQWSYTLFGIESGTLVETVTLFGESDIYQDESGEWETEPEFYLDEQLITEEEFNALRIMYGLDHIWERFGNDTNDESSMILSMTVLAR